MSQRATLPTLTDRVTVGPFEVSPYCIGGVDDPDVIPAAFDAGCNFFFVSADMHWPRYEPSRKGLAALFARGTSIRDQVVVAAVSYVAQPDFAAGPICELIEDVRGMERADITIAGGCYARDVDRRVPGLALASEIHGARAHGATFHDRKAAARALTDERLQLVFARFNAVHRGARRDIFPKVTPETRPLFLFTTAHGVRSREALGLPDSNWLPRHTDHYKYALADDRVAGILCAPRKLSEFEDLKQMVAEAPLSQPQLKYIDVLGDLASGTAVLSREA